MQNIKLLAGLFAGSCKNTHFRKIHDTVTGLQVKEVIPVPGHPDIVIGYQHLLELEEDGISTYRPEGLRKDINVKQLLDGIESEQNRSSSTDERREFQKKVKQEVVTKEDQRIKEIKTKINQNAKRYARSVLISYYGILVCVVIAFGFLTWKYGWDTIEPWTYFFGSVLTLLPYGYFVFTLRLFSPRAIYDHIVEIKRKKHYTALGLEKEV